jgi:NTP pyrophosphatase (non-canonical NTP hydrolase)
MELSEYQRLSRRTAEYPRDAWLSYPALGLAGEAGEVAEHAKKVIRDDGGAVTEERRGALKKELGDVLWYVAQLASGAACCREAATSASRSGAADGLRRDREAGEAVGQAGGH